MPHRDCLVVRIAADDAQTFRIIERIVNELEVKIRLFAALLKMQFPNNTHPSVSADRKPEVPAHGPISI
jgi:hypothetical protein